MNGIWKRLLCLILVAVCLFTAAPVSRAEIQALPDEIYLTQQGSGTCTLTSAAMMIRSSMYIHGNDAWSTVTPETIRPVAWINGVGLKWNFRFTTESCVVTVSYQSLKGISADELKAVLDAHPEGIVLYCGNVPHAVFLMGYEGDVFYCAETVNGYSGKRIPLVESWMGGKFNSQEALLNNVTACWYVSSYEGDGTEACGCQEAHSGIYRCTTTTSELLIRGGHGTGYSVVGYIPSGAEVTVTKASGTTDDDWAHVIYNGVGGYASMKYLEKIGELHQYEAVVHEPTCTETGSTVHTCKDCGHSYTDSPVEPLGHDYGPWIPDGTGKETRTCTRCGGTEERDAVLMGTVTGSDLCIRSGAGTTNQVLGYLQKGDRVEILETKVVGSMTWGRISEGWISLTYVDLDEPAAEPSEPTKPSEPSEPSEPTEPEEDDPAMEPLTVTVQYYGVNIRKGPGIDYGISGQANKGDRMTITEVQTGSGYTWGKFDGGWIALMYTDYEDLLQQQPEEDTPPETDPETPAMDPLTITVRYYGVNIRKGPGTNYGITGQANKGDQMTITEVQTGYGYSWGKFDGGWIALLYTDYEDLLAQESEEPPMTEPPATEPPATEPEEPAMMGTVTGSDLRIRSAAGTSNKVVGFLQKGDRVEILETKVVSGMTWGRISEGWISLSYVDLDDAQQAPDAEPEKRIVTVTADCLRVRSGAGLPNSIVGFLYRGAKVEILETKDVNGTTWGRTDKGWISMDYVQ